MAVSKLRASVQVSPAGAAGQVQFNNAGVMAGDAGLTYDPATGKLTVSKVESQGSIGGNIVTKAVGDSPYSVAADDYTILVNASGGAVTINLPAVATNAKRMLNIKKIDSSSNNVTVDGNAAETIDGALTQVLKKQWESISVQCDGSSWYII
jgi:hypothetical protein